MYKKIRLSTTMQGTEARRHRSSCRLSHRWFSPFARSSLELLHHPSTTETALLLTCGTIDIYTECVERHWGGKRHQEKHKRQFQAVVLGRTSYNWRRWQRTCRFIKMPCTETLDNERSCQMPIVKMTIDRSINKKICNAAFFSQSVISEVRK